MDKIRIKLDEFINRRMVLESLLINSVRSGDEVDICLMGDIKILTEIILFLEDIYDEVLSERININ